MTSASSPLPKWRIIRRVRVKIGGDSRAPAPPAEEVMAMAKPKIELGQMSPPYMEWLRGAIPCFMRMFSVGSLPANGCV
jgi:hypothetical protein